MQKYLGNSILLTPARLTSEFMIDKNFYLENLTAFDELIGSDRTEAEKVIYKVYCILQRDKIWLYNVATPEEMTEEDEDLLVDIENELSVLDQTYNFRFQEFHEMVLENLGAENSAWADQDDEDDEDDDFEDIFGDLYDDEELYDDIEDDH